MTAGLRTFFDKIFLYEILFHCLKKMYVFPSIPLPATGPQQEAEEKCMSMNPCPASIPLIASPAP
jgi:hypothetical protein